MATAAATSESTLSDLPFISELPTKEKTDLELELGTFVVKHATHHRPIALVSSGGTAADLEINSVRSLDNFSTGLRGAVSVEEFLRRGYAVIHLWRRGSAAPYARVLSQAIGLSQANHGLSVDSLGKLFSGDFMSDENDEDYLIRKVLDQEADPWLTDTSSLRPSQSTTGQNWLTVHRHLLYYTKLQKALKERTAALREGRLLTVPFRTIEEYLAKLQMSAEAMSDSRSLALIYLAAAVSDYYIPKEGKSEHKIQSQAGGNEEGITLQLHPVPKTMGLLKSKWAPESFVVSFKLETDKAILREKAEKAVEKYACDMVIGNLLHTRHSNVWILSPPDKLDDTNSDNSQSITVQDWPFQEISKAAQHHDAADSQDSLESAIIDFVVQSHFEFISHFGYDEEGAAGMETAKRRQAELIQKKRRLRRQAFTKHIQDHAMTVAGAVIAVVISSTISAILQRRAGSRQ